MTYEYAATVVRVIDGDTAVVDIDLGFHTWRRNQSIRLLDCNARELSMPGGPEARDHLSGLLPAGTQVTVSTVKVDKYGDRYDGAVTLPDGRDLVTVLAESGWVALWDGHGLRPVPDWPITGR